MTIKKLTIKEAKQWLANRGMTLRKRDDEFRVNFKGGNEASAYYTNDLRDACETGREMACHLEDQSKLKNEAVKQTADTIAGLVHDMAAYAKFNNWRDFNASREVLNREFAKFYSLTID